jgi:hypothetical protein
MHSAVPKSVAEVGAGDVVGEALGDAVVGAAVVGTASGGTGQPPFRSALVNKVLSHVPSPDVAGTPGPEANDTWQAEPSTCGKVARVTERRGSDG